ncbi:MULTISPECIES: mechanosensitive ion channel family protein [unclassified Ensifer]|uniref:mechanosensitive ion channel family protein n=1 Tax=unclassified Ensifer TaxID=2633371 RepID=UPI00070CB310|nr:MULTISPECIES: mechanosensitive ion channel family protein [unclassified Ensifer]KQU87682.1 small mechanosensitive ion channel [Ensifer sp. Root31]KQW52662.1 small mechanosensitive ion channel [Ensifer sp. Root1252]KQW78539.1 small mechanosensitive ion channel [Ensifer sp. Root127]KQY68479.1 small mechanosensitive ion channel [Ensifer sp. Root142]KRC71076.1 small mechanosensitive ion channel [Ensifer sp. Root231]
MFQAYLIEIAAAPLAWLIILGLTGIAVWKFIGPTRSNLRLVVQIIFFTAMTSVIVLADIPLGQSQGLGIGDEQAAFIVFAQLLWWLHLSWAVIGFVRIYLVLEGRPREARLLQDIVVGAVYMCVTLAALAFVFGAPVGTLIATSGVIAIALGLALQNTLGDVFSGVALNLGHTYVLGDWILLEDGTEGRVIASTWRSTQILTGANNIVVLPNSVLAKLKLTNVSRPDETHLLKMTVRVVPTHAPSIIEEAMLTVLAGCNSIMREPPPLVSLSGVDATALEIHLFFRVSNPMLRMKAQNEVIDRFYRHCRSAGIQLAMPPMATINGTPSNETARPPDVTLQEVIDENPIFSGLTRSEREKLAQSGIEREYRKGDVIVSQGQSLPSMTIIRTGVVSMQHDQQEKRRLSAGDFFGETGLLAGMHEAYTLQALTRIAAYEIDQKSFARLIADRPAIAEEVAAMLSACSGDNSQLPMAAAKHERSASAFLKSIRTIFST